MNSALPNPTTQTGLLAYYTFDNLLNKQGNTAFNGVINGNAVINTTNTSCAFIVDSCQVLPVTLLSFTAAKMSNAVQLNWATAQEQNSNSFDIESSTNGVQFKKLASVRAAGYSNAIKNYVYSDQLPAKGLNYYRLKQIDIDGKFVYSPIRNVKFEQPKSFTIYNNPVKRGETLQVSLQDISGCRVEMINSVGQLIYRNTEKLTVPVLNILILPSTATGSYILRVINNNEVSSEKILVL